jgi:hypothetical protein
MPKGSPLIDDPFENSLYLTAVWLSEKETRENPLVSVASGEKWTVPT